MGQYRFKNLQELSKYIQMLADKERDREHNAHTLKEGAVHRASAAAYEDCADMINNTTLTEVAQ